MATKDDVDDDKALAEHPVAFSDADESSDDDDDELGLEGVLVRNPDASSSSDDEDEEVAEDENDEKVATHEEETKSTKKRPAAGTNAKKTASKTKRKKRSNNDEPDVINVTFTFCDMDEKYFHALKSLLHASSTVYQQHSSALTDHMIDNVSVGTLISTQDDGDDHNVYGFASVLNVTTYQSSPAIQDLKQQCLQHCPKDRNAELQVVLGGETKRPAGFLLFGRMVNLPLEITLELYQQLVKDLDWAVENAEGGVEERKSLDFGVFLRLAPCQQEGSSVVYRYFEDELFAGRAEFCFTIDAPKAYSKEEKQLVNVMAMTKQGFRDAVADIAKMVGG